LPISWQSAGEDRDKNDVVDPENDLENRQSQKPNPGSRVAKPIHQARIVSEAEADYEERGAKRGAKQQSHRHAPNATEPELIQSFRAVVSIEIVSKLDG
jgi:hypothetical protein